MTELDLRNEHCVQKSLEEAEVEDSKNGLSNEQRAHTSLEEEAFLSYFHQSKLPHPDKWSEESPIYISASRRAPAITYDILPQQSETPPPFPLDGTIISFDGPLFKGKIVSRVKDVPAMNMTHRTPSCPTTQYFKSKSRMFQWTVQGTFKKRIRFDKVVTGQEFARPFRNAPSASIVRKGISLLRSRLPDTFEWLVRCFYIDVSRCNSRWYIHTIQVSHMWIFARSDLFADKPRFEHPLISGCQCFRVDKIVSLHNCAQDTLIGETEAGDIIEDTTLLGNEVPSSSERRRKYFSKQKNLQKYFFETNYVYTFDFCSNFFSPARHRLQLAPIFSFDLIPYFNGCP